MRIAILDFGTNTFNLLIADTLEDNKLKMIHSSKEPVKLGKGGIHKKIITDEAQERALSAIERHYEKINEHGAEKVYAFATSAIRDASNARQFVNVVKEKFNLYVNIIPGEKEAELIYKGVRQSYPMGKETVIILDIGGGSNEFIIANNEQIFWKESFNLGMARMLEMFPVSDPIKESEIKTLLNHFKIELKPLFEAVEKYKPLKLVGSSGSFETFSTILSFRKSDKYKMNESLCREISYDDYLELHQTLLKSTLEERKIMPGMEPVRIEMIVIASIFVSFVLEKCQIKEIIQSDYALKEGVIGEIFNI
jgi:exopolyphosphatase / guanosine-5'-triphosphate,3'-diphosphate pyrophosphatase